MARTSIEERIRLLLQGGRRAGEQAVTGEAALSPLRPIGAAS